MINKQNKTKNEPYFEIVVDEEFVYSWAEATEDEVGVELNREDVSDILCKIEEYVQLGIQQIIDEHLYKKADNRK